MRLFRRTASVTLGLVCILCLAGFRSAEADSIIPASYTYGFPPGLNGDSLFQDPNDTKLTDGVLGTTNYSDGSWIGFTQKGQIGDGIIVFTFSSSVTITDVSIDFLREDYICLGCAPIGVPTWVSIGVLGTTLSSFTPANFSTNPTAGFIDFTGSWTGTQLEVEMSDLSAPFISEVEFTTSSSGATPEPGTVGLALVGIAAVLGWRRKRNSLRR